MHRFADRKAAHQAFRFLAEAGGLVPGLSESKALGTDLTPGVVGAELSTLFRFCLTREMASARLRRRPMTARRAASASARYLTY